MENAGAQAEHIRLSGPLTLRQSSSLKEVLLSALAVKQSITISIPEECEADISFVQLLLAAQVSARSAGKTIRLKEPASGSLFDVLSRGGFLENDPSGFWGHQ